VLAASSYAIRVGTHSVTLQESLYSALFVHWASPANASLAYSLAYVLLCWLVMAMLYRRRIFLKI
jgi:predicted acyltransferase